MAPIEAVTPDEPVELDESDIKRRRGRRRKGRPVGRYLMCVSQQPEGTQIAVLEGRSLIEHYVARPTDDVDQIHGNIYLGRVQNVLPGMEAAFVDIGTPKNAVLYRGDVQYDPEDIDEGGKPRIEEILKAKQTIICQVTKNPIAHKGARLTQEVSLPGRFVVLVPEQRHLRHLEATARRRAQAPAQDPRQGPTEGHGLIVRTAAEGITAEEITTTCAGSTAVGPDRGAGVEGQGAQPALPRARHGGAGDPRGVQQGLPSGGHRRRRNARGGAGLRGEHHAGAGRAGQFYDPVAEQLSLFERYHVHEQLHKALDRKVWLPSGGSLIIEHTEALTVIDVNTGKNVGSSSLEETVTATTSRRPTRSPASSGCATSAASSSSTSSTWRSRRTATR